MILAKPEIFAAIALLIVFVVLLAFNKLPSMQSFIDFVNALNTRGGNILILTLLSAWTFVMGVRFLYHAIDLGMNGKIDSQNSIIQFGLTAVFSSAFGAFSGALLKTMTGDAMTSSSATPGTTSTTTSVVASTTKEGDKHAAST